MLKKQNILKTILSFALLFVFQIKSIAQETSNFIVTMEGEKIECFGKIRLDATRIIYDNAEGKTKASKQKKIKVMVINNRVFLNLEIKKNFPRLQEVYAYNEDYIITGYWQTSTFFYVWDKDFNPIDGRISFSVGGVSKINRNQTKFDEKILKYLTDCDAVVARFNKNIQADLNINDGVSYYNCDESDSPLEKYMKLNK